MIQKLSGPVLEQPFQSQTGNQMPFDLRSSFAASKHKPV
jgi:hypothetical protein